MDSTFHMAYRDDASLFMHNMKMCRPGQQTLSHVETKIYFISGAFCLRQNAQRAALRAAGHGQATSGKADVDFPEISSVRSIGSSDSGRVLVVRTELRQLRQRQLRSPVSVLFTHKLTSAALGSGVACYRPPATTAPRRGCMVQARKMKSCLDVTILVGITTIAGDLIKRNANSRPKIEVF